MKMAERLFYHQKEWMHVNSPAAPYTLRGFRSLHPTTRRLIAARFLRSIAQGALAVDFVLYLHLRGWNAPEIGMLLMSGGLAGAALSLVVGVSSDRIGRKLFLLIYETGLALGTGAVLLTQDVWLLVLVAALFGFGRGANGASGPFAPAEQAWLAQDIPAARRGTVFSFNAALQFWGMGVGSILSGFLPHLWPGATGPAAYDPLFALNLIIAIINYVQIATLHEETPKNGVADSGMEPTAGQDEAAERTERAENLAVRQRENKALTLLTIVNMVNALGVGVVAPLMPYWFSVRFGVGPEAIGPVYGLTFLLTGLSSLFVGRMSEQIGLTKSILLPRLIGIVMLIALPLVPTFSMAAVLYVIRSIVNRGSMGARQAFSVGLVRDQRRGLASSLNAVSWNVPAAVGPAVGGWLLGMGSLFWPFALAAGLQLAYIVMFGAMLGPYDPQRKQANAG